MLRVHGLPPEDVFAAIERVLGAAVTRPPAAMRRAANAIAVFCACQEHEQDRYAEFVQQLHAKRASGDHASFNALHKFRTAAMATNFAFIAALTAMEPAYDLPRQEIREHLRTVRAAPPPSPPIPTWAADAMWTKSDPALHLVARALSLLDYDWKNAQRTLEQIAGRKFDAAYTRRLMRAQGASPTHRRGRPRSA